MIARVWRGWATAATADDYQRHYESEVAEHRGFAGEEPEQAVVEEAARRSLTRWEERVAHHEVTVLLPGPAPGVRETPVDPSA